MAVRAVMADYRVALTGTPVENHVGDLWSIMDFLNPDFLGTQEQFRRDFLVPIQAHRDPDAVEKLAPHHQAVHPAPAQDRPRDHLRPARQARDEGVLHAHAASRARSTSRSSRRRSASSRTPRASSGAA